MDGFVFGIQMTDDPNSVVWYAAEPPEGLELNYLDYMKFGTAIFNGNFDPDAYARAAVAEERIRCLVNLIERDNKVFGIATTDPRIKIKRRKITAPIVPKGYEQRKFAVREDLLTLRTDEVNRYETYYDFTELPIWGVSSQKKSHEERVGTCN